MTIRLQRQGFEIDLGIFPDLRIDESPEQPLEHLFEQAFAGQYAMTADRLFETDVTLDPRVYQSQHPGTDSIRDIYPPVHSILMTTAARLST